MVTNNGGQSKNRLPSYLLCSAVMMIGALDFGAVIPSLWDYVRMYGGDKQFLGYTVSAFMFCRMLCQPVIGSLTDRIGFKSVYIFTIVVQLVGEVLYAFLPGLRRSKWLIIVGRMVCGIGSANGDLGYAYMGRTLPQDQVTSQQLALTASRSVGTVLGPAASIFLQGIHYDLGWGLEVTYKNAPALVIAALDAFALIGILALFEDLRPERTDSKVEATVEPLLQGAEQDNAGAQGVKRPGMWSVLLRPGVLITMAMVCISANNLGLIEVIIPPVGEAYFHWVPADTSALFAALGFSVMLINFSLARCNKTWQLSDRLLIAVGAIISQIGAIQVWAWWKNDSSFTQIRYITSLAVYAVCQPSFMIGSLRALFTKLIPRELQGVLQGICSFVYSLGNLIGPNLSAYALERGLSHVRMLMMASCLVNVILIAIGWSFMFPREMRDAKPASETA